MVFGDQLDDAAQSADFDRIMIWHRNMELTIEICGQANV